jgi:hypothetical protein
MSGTQYVRFDDLRTTIGGKHRWVVISTLRPIVLGFIEWSLHREWYSFTPDDDHAFDATSLEQIAAFIKEQNEAKL